MGLMAMGADEVVEEFGPALARIAASYERNPALREDLLQEMFLAVCRALPRLKEPSKLKPFVFRIAHNRAMTHIVRRMREPASLAEPDAIAAEAPTQEQSLIAGERSARLLEAVRTLPLAYRQAVTLVLEGLSYSEIAETLGITPNNVGVRISRARDQLRSLLGHE
jgi:RNA polymerase sigma factor (sigma-70 family)